MSTGGSIEGDIANAIIELLLSNLPISAPIKRIIDYIKLIPGIGDAVDTYMNYVKNAINKELKPLTPEELEAYQKTHQKEITQAEKIKAQKLAQQKKEWAELDKKFNTPQKKASPDYLRLKARYEQEFKKYGGVLLGGLIHEVKQDMILKKRSLESFPSRIVNLYNMATIQDTETEQISINNLLIGSSRLVIQKYFSDIDINEKIKGHGITRNKIIEIFISKLQHIIKGVIKNKNVYFSDFKAGVNADGSAIRWKPREILAGKKNDITLEEAINQKSIIKLDIIALIDGPRYIELSTFFILSEGENNINLDDDFNQNFYKNLFNDIIHYTEPGQDENIFKAVKRLWSLASLTHNYELLESLEPLIDSNLSLLAQIRADLETLILMLEKVEALPTKHIQLELENMKLKLSGIPDININQPYYNTKLDEVANFFNDYIKKGSRTIIINLLDRIRNKIKQIINDNTKEYLDHINLNLRTLIF